jgi:hypothetical protein
MPERQISPPSLLLAYPSRSSSPRSRSLKSQSLHKLLVYWLPLKVRLGFPDSHLLWNTLLMKLLLDEDERTDCASEVGVYDGGAAYVVCGAEVDVFEDIVVVGLLRFVFAR